MLEWIWLIPALPLAGFLVLALGGARLPRGVAGTIGVASVGASAALALFTTASFVASDRSPVTQKLWTWMSVGGFEPAVGFHLDALALTMVLVVTVVGFLIHLYATEFMAHEEGFSRFFAYMNLFVAAMLVLVLADNLLLLYLGWEGVGLCSFLLIGFWYRDPANAAAARKAFIVTRAGDTALAIGLFLLFTHLGTLDIQQAMARAAEQWPVGSAAAVAAACLLLGGAVGKSAQLPLQTWLPDAMAGPTPVSALIHAATMVTAGVYLIARTHALFELAPGVLFAVGVVGAATMLLAACSALVQSDIKRVLAYSTMSQIGYMFLALGAGAWAAAIFHLVTHAFFKALLFLGAGAVILALHHEHDMFKMGGLWRRLPVTFWTFLVGAAALAALPLVTSGFYSKEAILAAAFSEADGSFWLGSAGLLGALLTSVYTFRMVFVTFFGRLRQEPGERPGARIHLVLVVLAVLTIAGGLFGVSEFLRSALPSLADDSESTIALEIIAAVVALAGVGIAYGLFARDSRRAEQGTAAPTGRALERVWFTGWGFDRLYDALAVRPYARLAALNKNDVVDRLYLGAAAAARAGYVVLSASQTGRVRGYAKAMALGAVVAVALLMVL